MYTSNRSHFKLFFVLCAALFAHASQFLPDYIPIDRDHEAHVQRRAQNVSSTLSAVSSTHSISLSWSGAPSSSQSVTISSRSQVSSGSSSLTSPTHQVPISRSSSSIISTTSSHSASTSHTVSGSQSASTSHHTSPASASSTTSKAGQPTKQPTGSGTSSATRSETSSASESSKASSPFTATSNSSKISPTASTAKVQSTTSSSTPAGQGPTSTTSTGQTTSSSSSPSSQAAITTYVPPTTTVAGAAETSTIIAIAPVFAGVWKNKGDLEDAKKKDKYVEEVKNTKNQVDTLFKNLPDKPEPPSECSSTASGSSGDSLISGVLNILNTPAKLISCAEKVVGNLADAVVVNPPVIAAVTVLTETLKQIGAELEKDKKDDENTSRDTTATTTTSSGCSTSTVKSCALTTTLSTLWVADGTTSSSKFRTLTTTSCATITGCSVTATTATTTVSTSTASSSSGYICGAGCAAGGCKAGVKRTAAVAPTAAPGDGEPAAAPEKRSLKPTGMIKDVDKYVIGQLKASIATGLDWSAGEAVSQFHDFLNKASNPYIPGVTGCTAIVIASEKGAWVSHFMETALMPDEGRQPERDRMDAAVRNGNGNYIKPADLAGDGGALHKAAKPQIFVSAACEHTNGACHTDGDGPVFEHARVKELLNTLFGPGTPFEGIAVVKRGYIRPASMTEVDELADTSARGKVLVQYDPNQRAADFSQPDPRQAVYRVWLESQSYEHQWQATQCQGGNAPAGRRRADSCPRDGTVSVSATRTESSPTTTRSSSSKTESSSKTSSSATTTESSSLSKTASSSSSSSSSSPSRGASSSPPATKATSSSTTFKTSTIPGSQEASATPPPATTKKPDATTTKPAEPPATTTTVTCSDEKRTFTQAQADEAIDDFCGHNRVYTLDPGRPAPYIFASTEMNLVLQRSPSRSSAGGGCATPRTTTVSLADCKKYFRAAVDACDKGRADKHGARSLTWRSPDGCIDFLIEAYAF